VWVPEPINEPVHDEYDGEVPDGDLAQLQHRHDDHHLNIIILLAGNFFV
jgi:hypothetical protein